MNKGIRLQLMGISFMLFGLCAFLFGSYQLQYVFLISVILGILLSILGYFVKD